MDKGISVSFCFFNHECRLYIILEFLNPIQPCVNTTADCRFLALHENRF